MAWTDPLASVFETGDILTQGNIGTYLLDNLLALPHKLDYNVTDLDVVNTTAETTFYTVTVPANTLGTTGLIGMHVIGDIKGTAAGAHVCTFRLKFGGVTHITWSVDAVNLATYLGINIIIGVANKNATNAQLVWVQQAAMSTGGYSGSHSFGTEPVTAAIDTTVDQALLITVQWGVGNATNSVRRLVARTELGRN